MSLLILALPSQARAGYELPSPIDGRRSVDGRFLITAEPIDKATNHAPNRWSFDWKAGAACVGSGVLSFTRELEAVCGYDGGELSLSLLSRHPVAPTSRVAA